ncbi:hypothetical protein [Candidatus Binatus sp.]|uniref:hypothetical protein n=1 Tax=Candidatus Binatus sp. TaxID=2811406 RepID=UPI003BAF4044
MRDRPANIVPKKAPVEWQRRRECFDLGQAAARKSSSDEIFLAATHFHDRTSGAIRDGGIN